MECNLMSPQKLFPIIYILLFLCLMPVEMANSSENGQMSVFFEAIHSFQEFLHPRLIDIEFNEKRAKLPVLTEIMSVDELRIRECFFDKQIMEQIAEIPERFQTQNEAEKFKNEKEKLEWMTGELNKFKLDSQKMAFLEIKIGRPKLAQSGGYHGFAMDYRVPQEMAGPSERAEREMEGERLELLEELYKLRVNTNKFLEFLNMQIWFREPREFLEDLAREDEVEQAYKELRSYELLNHFSAEIFTALKAAVQFGGKVPEKLLASIWILSKNIKKELSLLRMNNSMVVWFKVILEVWGEAEDLNLAKLVDGKEEFPGQLREAKSENAKVDTILGALKVLILYERRNKLGRISTENGITHWKEKGDWDLENMKKELKEKVKEELAHPQMKLADQTMDTFKLRNEIEEEGRRKAKESRNLDVERKMAKRRAVRLSMAKKVKGKIAKVFGMCKRRPATNSGETSLPEVWHDTKTSPLSSLSSSHVNSSPDEWFESKTSPLTSPNASESAHSESDDSDSAEFYTFLRPNEPPSLEGVEEDNRKALEESTNLFEMANIERMRHLEFWLYKGDKERRAECGQALREGNAVKLMEKVEKTKAELEGNSGTISSWMRWKLVQQLCADAEADKAVYEFCNFNDLELYIEGFLKRFDEFLVHADKEEILINAAKLFRGSVTELVKWLKAQKSEESQMCHWAILEEETTKLDERIEQLQRMIGEERVEGVEQVLTKCESVQTILKAKKICDEAKAELKNMCMRNNLHKNIIQFLDQFKGQSP